MHLKDWTWAAACTRIKCQDLLRAPSKCLYRTHNSDLFTHLCGPSGKWWSLKTVLARQILYHILRGRLQSKTKSPYWLFSCLTKQLLCTGVNQFIIVNTALQHVCQVNSELLLSASHVASFKQALPLDLSFQFDDDSKMFGCVYFSCKFIRCVICTNTTSAEVK